MDEPDEAAGPGRSPASAGTRRADIGTPRGASDTALRVAPGVAIPFAELAWRFSASGGAGGQHVNTANTKAEVVFDVAGSPSLAPAVRDLLVGRLGAVVAVAASDRRSQARNRELALARLADRLRAALETPAPRRATRPTLASKRRRVEAKRRRAARKQERRGGWGEE